MGDGISVAKAGNTVAGVGEKYLVVSTIHIEAGLKQSGARSVYVRQWSYSFVTG